MGREGDGDGGARTTTIVAGPRAADDTAEGDDNYRGYRW